VSASAHDLLRNSATDGDEILHTDSTDACHTIHRLGLKLTGVINGKKIVL